MITAEINPHIGGADPGNHARPTVVVMAKCPVPGRVKTRLLAELSPEQAARVHAAMLRCVLARASAHLEGERVLALDQAASGTAPDTAPALEVPSGWRCVDQGAGDLGERLARVWRAVGAGAVVFLGVDSPDVPAEALQAIAPALGACEAAIGPVADGGYWTLAASHYLPALLAGIDWGSSSVYHQTVEAASRSGLRWRALLGWYDVDDPADLAALQRRLAAADEPALVQLHRDLEHILTGVKP